MAARYANWWVSGYIRTDRDEHGDLMGEPLVVIITEPRRWEWELTLDRGGLVELRTKSISVPPTPMTRKTNHHDHVEDLVKIAQLYLARVDKIMAEDHYPEFLAAELAAIRPGEQPLDTRPGLPEFVAAWEEEGARSVITGKPRRQLLAEKYNVTVYAIDKWVGKARDRGLIPEAEMGRRKKRTDRASE